MADQIFSIFGNETFETEIFDLLVELHTDGSADFSSFENAYSYISECYSHTFSFDIFVNIAHDIVSYLENEKANMTDKTDRRLDAIRNMRKQAAITEHTTPKTLSAPIRTSKAASVKVSFRPTAKRIPVTASYYADISDNLVILDMGDIREDDIIAVNNAVSDYELAALEERARETVMNGFADDTFTDEYVTYDAVELTAREKARYGFDYIIIGWPDSGGNTYDYLTQEKYEEYMIAVNEWNEANPAD